ncbi:MAG: enoyl-CoA hydratase/isomerase family protein [Alphaproteobacteria bacterium]
MIEAERQADGRLDITLNRPRRRNALDSGAMATLADMLASAGRDPDLRCVVIKGAGGVFSAGRDLKQAADLDQPTALAQHAAWGEVFQALRRLPAPSIAVVEGAAVAGGFTLAMATDFLIAERKAVFGALEMANGFPAAMCTPILAKKAAPRFGLEMALFGKAESAERLYAAGLVNRLADGPEALAAEADAFVAHILSLNPLAVRQTLGAYRAAESQPLEQALTAGITLNQLIEASGTFKAGSASFAKR